MTKLPTGRHTQEIKSDRKNKENYFKNKAHKTRVKTYIHKINTAIETKDSAQIKETSIILTKFIDKAASKGAIHSKKAARLKSRISKKINNIKK